MAQAGNCWPLIMEVLPQSQVVHVGFMVDKVALVYVALQVLWFPCQYTSTNDPYSYFIPSTITTTYY
jgi:hypothetical protein